jgi:DNA primase
MFPIQNVRDQIIGFGARMLGDGDGPKYLNSPETVLFNKSNCLYGLNRAKGPVADKGFVAVVEGYTDVLMAHQLGVPHVVATLGTALTREHIGVLRRYARRVVLVYDADAAGEKASDRGIELFLEEDVDVSLATLPSGLDPCDFLVQSGPRPFEERLENAQEILAFKLQLARGKYDFTRMDEKTRATEEILALLPKISNKIKRDLFLSAVAAELKISEVTLRARAASLVQQKRRAPDGRAETVKAGTATREEKAERFIVTFLLRLPDRAASVFHEVSPDEFSTPAYKTIFQVVSDVYEAEGRIDPATVIGVLETRWPGQEPGRIAASILAEGVEKQAEDAEEKAAQDAVKLQNDVQGSLRWFSTQRKRKEVAELRERLKEASAHGDLVLERELLGRAQARERVIQGITRVEETEHSSIPAV